MSDCGGSCGGGASGGDGASSSPGDSASSAKDAKKPHACKCVCVCGTKTGVEPTEVLRSYEFPVEPRAIQPGTGGPPEPAPGFARETVAWSGWDPSPGRSLEPPRPPEFGGVPPDPPPGPGIPPPWPPRPPLTFEEIYGPDRDRGRGTYAMGRGSADVSAAAVLPIVRSEDPPPPPPNRGTMWMWGPGPPPPPRRVLVPGLTPASPVPPLASRSPGGLVQGNSSAVAAVMDAPPRVMGAWAYGGSMAPPDATRFPTPTLPAPATLAPPHAGMFTLSGPDGPPGSGIGARAFPIPGSDGTPRWRPSQDAARRTPDSDLDAHRPLQAMRMPFASIEGDSGPALDPVPRGVALPDGLATYRGFARPPLHPDEGPGASRATVGAMVPITSALGPTRTGAIPYDPRLPLGPVATRESILTKVPPAFEPLPASRALALVQPPAGPWDAGTAARSMPQVAGYAAAAIAQPPLHPSADQPSTSPESSADPYAATGRPAQSGVEALKAASRGAVPVDQWRPPKPEMPGSPTGQKGRGPGIGALSAMSQEFDRAIEARDAAREAVAVASAAAAAAGKDDAAARRALAYAEYVRDQAEIEVQKASHALGTQAAGAGSQWEERADEARKRAEDAARREQDREDKKWETRPNYDVWKDGDNAEKHARDLRGTVNDLGDQVTDLRGKADPRAVAELRALANELKALRKDLKNKASEAKDQSKGGVDDAAAALDDLKAAQKAFDEKQKALEDKLAKVKAGEDGSGASCAGGRGCGGAGGGGPSPSAAVPPASAQERVEYTIEGAVGPDCQKYASKCQPPDYPCENPDLKWVCNVRDGDPLPGGKGGVADDGVKGKGQSGDEGGGGGSGGGSAPAGSARETVVAGDGRKREPGEISPDASPAPDEKPAETPGDTGAEASDEEFVREMAKDRQEMDRAQDRIGRRVLQLEAKAAKYFERLARGRELTPRDEARFAAILRDLSMERLSWSLVSGLVEQQSTATSVGLLAGGPFRDQVREMSRELVEVSKVARRVVETAVEAQEAHLAEMARARAVAARGYTDEDLSKAQALLNLAWFQEPAGDRKADVADYLATRVKPAREEIRRLGLSLDSSSVNAVQLAQRLFSQRRDAGMVAADEATSLSSVAWRMTVDALSSAVEPAGRALAATEKLIEAAVTGLQTISTATIAGQARLLKSFGLESPFFAPEAFDQLARRQAESFVESGRDIGRLLAGRDLDRVRDRITDATLGGATLYKTPEEHQFGSDPLMDFARAFAHFNSATIKVTGGIVAGAGAASGAKALLSSAKALAWVRNAGSAVASQVADAARMMPKTVQGWIEAAKASLKVSVHGGEAAASGLSRASLLARDVLRPGLEKVARLKLAYKVPKTLSVQLERFFATATKGYAGVDESIVARLLRRVPGLSEVELEQSHIFIQQRWFRAGGPTAWYSAEDAARLGLQRVGNAGWNLMPLPRGLNQALGRSPWGSAAFGGVVAGGVVLTPYGAYKAGKWAGDQIAGIGDGE